MRLYNGMVLRDIAPCDYLKHDLVKPRGTKWHVDEFDKGDGTQGYVLTLRVGERTYSIKWVGERTVENKKLLKKLMLRWYWDDVGALETKAHQRLPFDIRHHAPVWGY